MKIIRQGVRPEDRTYRGTCTDCTTEVEFTKGEAARSLDQREPGIYVKCPTCKGTIWGQPYTVLSRPGDWVNIHPHGR